MSTTRGSAALLVAGLLMGWILFGRNQSFAQSTPSNPNASGSTNNPGINDLRTPPSPAFVLLGIEPSSVERPSTPRALAASLLSASGQNDIIPRNYALEFSPYWLSSHPNLTFEEYYHAGVVQSLAQTFSVSFATSKEAGSDTTAQGTEIGIGLRSQLVSGGPTKRLDSLRAQMDALHEKRGDYIHIGDTANARLTQERIAAVAKQIAAEDHNRTGWIVELAGAATERFPHNSFGQESLHRVGIWLTPSYSWDDPKVEFLVVARIFHDADNVGHRNLFDGGLRLVYNAGGFSVSSEYVNRSSFGNSANTQTASPNSGISSAKNTYRLSANVEYKYSDAIYLSMTLGRNNEAVLGQGNLIAQLSVNFGFGEIHLPTGTE